jgi:hypothetical protein
MRQAAKANGQQPFGDGGCIELQCTLLICDALVCEIDLEAMSSKGIARTENQPVHHKTMKLLTRLLVLMMATLLLLLALVVISVFVLISGIRWLVTGKKPSFVLYVQAFQRFKASTNKAGKYRPGQNDIIDAEFREVKGDSDRLQ